MTNGWRARIARITAAGPWLFLSLVGLIALGYLVYFPDGADGDFPEIDRPTFSAYPPPAYRLAEPGDTLDRVGVYLSALAIGLGWIGLVRAGSKREGISGWILALVGSVVIGWHAGTPWPTFDGWHGWGWGVIGNAEAPGSLRAAVASAAALLALTAAISAVRFVRRGGIDFEAARRRRIRALLVVAALGILWRIVLRPNIEPFGFWPRWGLIAGLVAWNAVLIRCWPPKPERFGARLASSMGALASIAGVIAIGLFSIWYHRPIDRLRVVEPGKLYISAMPKPKGLEVAQQRHGFRTIINLFQEDLPGLKSPWFEEEVAFAREHEIDYLRSPLGAIHAEEFLSETLRLATDAEAQPVLVHCHGGVDRTPAWWGIYRFLVRGEPISEIMKSIEQHRGSRPKASVIVLYNRVLAERAPERYRNDPGAERLRRAQDGVVDPFYAKLEEERRQLARTEDERDVSSPHR